MDNAPGPADCREKVLAAGARYIREDRVGLDHARRAGLLAATGDLVCFTDDDCVPAVHWLRRLPALFADPSVGAVTGPAFALELATLPQVRFEDSNGFDRGLTSANLRLAHAIPAAREWGRGGCEYDVSAELAAEIGRRVPC